MLGRPKLLFTSRTGGNVNGDRFAVTPDGKEFLVPSPARPGTQTQSIHIITNWQPPASKS
ncbi:MAG: hypothetical protein EXQ57_10790 [Bryobacterales bacterium]|nr:hypothetical protein [Bryobacterales bacterium]